jgi:HIP---CoA ligase
MQPADTDPPLRRRADVEWGTVGAMVDGSAELFGVAEALVDADEPARRWTFLDLRRDVRRAAAAFLAAGVVKGDRVAIWAPNSPEWVIAGLGALSIGAVLVPLNTRFKGSEAAYILNTSRARLLICAEGFLGGSFIRALSDCGESLPHLERTVTWQTWAAFVAEGATVDDVEIDVAIAAVAPHDVSDLIFTSGTTGKPKGVMSTHAQMLRVFDGWVEVIGLAAGDRYLIVNPFFHTFGYKAGIIVSVMSGCAMVPQAVFDVARTLELVERERITVLPGPPTLFLSILDHPGRDAYDLSTLRLAVTGAASVPVEMILRMRAELTFSVVVTGYGLTESTGVVTMCRHDDAPETIAGTSGRAVEGVEVRIVDVDGTDVATGSPGELWCRGFNVMLGYFEDAARTAEAVTPDGWLRTGDIAVMDELGYVRITDRIKDMYVVGGFNAYPAEIEATLLGHPLIAQAAVIGVPDQRMGEVGHAFVVPRSGGKAPDPTEVVAWCRERMANFKVPRYVTVVLDLPTNATGKVMKYVLREGEAHERDL